MAKLLTVPELAARLEALDAQPVLTLSAAKIKVRDIVELARDLVERATSQARTTDSVYEERNRVVAAFAKMVLAAGGRAGTSTTSIEGWDPEWHNIVYIDTPSGQVSFHFHDREKPLFADLPAYDGGWDGHTTEEKFARLHAILVAPPPPPHAAPAATPDGDEEEAPRDWLVWSAAERKWWGPRLPGRLEPAGYVSALADAGRYSMAEARAVEGPPGSAPPTIAVHEPFAAEFLEQIGAAAPAATVTGEATA